MVDIYLYELLLNLTIFPVFSRMKWVGQSSFYKNTLLLLGIGIAFLGKTMVNKYFQQFYFYYLLQFTINQQFANYLRSSDLLHIHTAISAGASSTKLTYPAKSPHNTMHTIHFNFPALQRVDFPVYRSVNAQNVVKLYQNFIYANYPSIFSHIHQQ